MKRAKWVLALAGGLSAAALSSCGKGQGACWWVASSDAGTYVACVDTSNEANCKKENTAAHFEEGSCCSPWGDGTYSPQYCGMY